MTACDAQHPPITHGEATCPLCEALTLAHDLAHQVQALTTKLLAANKLCCEVLDREVVFLASMEATLNGHANSNGTRDDANVPT